MKLNRLEVAGIFAALAFLALAAVFAFSQAAYAQQVDPCSDIFPSIPGMSCEDDAEENQTPVDPCDITPCDEDESLGEQITCEVYEQLVAAGDPIPQGFDASGCDDDDDGGNGGETDVCPDEEGVQTETPCASDDDGEEGDDGGASGGGSSGGGSSSGGGGGGGGGGSVLGATTSGGGGGSSCHYLSGFIKPGAENDFDQVVRLQAFLKIFEGANVEVNGTYDAASIAAVHSFQTKYASEILTPWEISNSTGYVYLTTRKKVNEIYCDRGMTFPLTQDEEQVIETAKTAPAVAAPDSSRTGREVSIPTETETDTPARGTPVVDEPGNGFTNFFRRLFDRFR